eukprot:1916858-Pleurochrysis_carterae.AAC.1
MGGAVYVDNAFEDIDFPARKCTTLADAAQRRVGIHHVSRKRMLALWRNYLRAIERDGNRTREDDPARFARCAHATSARGSADCTRPPPQQCARMHRHAYAHSSKHARTHRRVRVRAQACAPRSPPTRTRTKERRRTSWAPRARTRALARVSMDARASSGVRLRFARAAFASSGPSDPATTFCLAAF